jgi:adenylate cyclase class 2
MLEVELKVKVTSLDPVRTRLTGKKARPSGRVREHDIYYNAPDRNFYKTDEALRVRYTGDRTVVTYKGAKIPSPGLKAREELTTAVESGEIFEQVLDRLGFTKAAEVNKWRENYRLGNALISLDTVEDLGTFVEIELIADDEKSDAPAHIKKIAEEIGVTGEPILASYLELALSKRSGVQP